MINLIVGEKGSGKTKKLIQMANDSIKESLGTIVFLDVHKRSIYSLNHDVRFINIKEYDIFHMKNLIPFINGIISRDHDIEKVYIDGLLKIRTITIDDIMESLDELNKLSEKFNVDFTMTLSYDEKSLPEKLKMLVS